MVPPFLANILRRTPTVAQLANRGVVSVTGSQASEFLNGLLSSSVSSPPRRPLYSAFLHAQGRVMYDVFVYTSMGPNGQTEYLFEYDSRPSEAPPLLPMLKRHVLRSKVKVRDVSSEYDIWTAWGSDSIPNISKQWTWAGSGAIEPVWEGNDWPWGLQDMSILDRRAPGLGRRLLVRKGDKPSEVSTHDVGSADDYLMHRIALGVPEGVSDIIPLHAFPIESNLDVMGGLDFRKGCYVGQELTVRTYHTGVVRKRILPVLLHQPGEPQQASGAIPEFLLHSDVRPTRKAQTTEGTAGPRPRGTGKLLSTHGQFGLALLRLEHAAGVLNNELVFEVGTPADGKTWHVRPWWPQWWPEAPAQEE